MSDSAAFVIRQIRLRPRSLDFALDDGAKVAIRKVLNVQPHYDARFNLESVTVETLDTGIGKLLKPGDCGELTVEVPTPASIDGERLEQDWLRHSYGHMSLASNHPDCPDDAFPSVLLVFWPGGRSPFPPASQ